ncbi:MAG: LPXTG cell wall anchor domain-containing protein [Faecalibacterium sp.]|nr:LPXTG cell wall anchor domain-containing protein [Faecalibacterium sp.]
MNDILKTYMERFRENRHTLRRYTAFVLALAMITTLFVNWQLHGVGISMTAQYQCGEEEHAHTADCYTKVLTCGYEEGELENADEVATAASTSQPTVEAEPAPLALEPQIEFVPHEHTDDCYTEVQTLTCMEEEHVHGDDCFDPEDGNRLICDKFEHTHDESCYTTEYELTCGLEEGELVEQVVEPTQSAELAAMAVAEPVALAPMVDTVEPIYHHHTDACYEEVLTCPLPEHQHTVACLSDTSADLETPEEWQAANAKAVISGNWAEDLLSVAKTQLGYEQSEKNFEIDPADGVTLRYYSRYGQSYGNPYGEWDVMFLSYCLKYAGIPQSAIPQEASVLALRSSMSDMDWLLDGEDGSSADVGDIVIYNKYVTRTVAVDSSADGAADGLDDQFSMDAEGENGAELEESGAAALDSTPATEDMTTLDTPDLPDIPDTAAPSVGSPAAEPQTTTVTDAQPVETVGIVSEVDENTLTVISGDVDGKVAEVTLSNAEVLGVVSVAYAQYADEMLSSAVDGALRAPMMLAAAGVETELSEDWITGTTITINGATYNVKGNNSSYSDLPNGVVVTVNDNVTLNYDFMIHDTAVQGTNTDTLTYKLPSHLIALEAGTNGPLLNEAGDKIGTIEVDQNGLATLKFDNALTGQTTGKFTITCRVSKTTTTTDNKITFPGDSHTIEIKNQTNLRIEKKIEKDDTNGLEITRLDDGYYKVHYKVTVNSDYGSGEPIELKDVINYISDTSMFTDIKYQNVHLLKNQYEISDSHEYPDYKWEQTTVDGRPALIITTKNGEKLPALEAGQWYRLDYELVFKKNKQGWGQIKNIATANGEIGGKDVNFTDELQKSGSHDPKTNTITWTIDIYPNGNKLTGFKLEDTLPAGTTIKGDIIIKNNSGDQKAKISDFDGASSFTYTFPNVPPFNEATPVGGYKYTVTYTTTAPANFETLGKVTNTATIKLKDGSEWKDEGDATYNKGQKEVTKKPLDSDTLNSSQMVNGVFTLPWSLEVNLPRNDWNSSGEIEITDTFITPKNGDHYAIKSELEQDIQDNLEITVDGTTYKYNTLPAGLTLEIKYYESEDCKDKHDPPQDTDIVRSFKLTFRKSDTFTGSLDKVVISKYSTKAKYDSSKLSAGQTIVFENKGEGVTASYQFTVPADNTKALVKTSANKPGNDSDGNPPYKANGVTVKYGNGYKDFDGHKYDGTYVYYQLELTPGKLENWTATTVTDKLSEHLSYVEGSAYVVVRFGDPNTMYTGNSWRGYTSQAQWNRDGDPAKWVGESTRNLSTSDFFSVTQSGKDLTFNLTENFKYLHSPTAKCVDRIMIRFAAKVDDNLLDLTKESDFKIVSNSASWNGLNASTDTEVKHESKLVKKTGKYSADNYRVEYSVIINPDALKLGDSDTITLEDEMSTGGGAENTAELVRPSVKLYDYDTINKTKGAEISSDVYSVHYKEPDATSNCYRLTVSVPNRHAYVLEYAYRNTSNTSYYMSNTAKLHGKESKVDSIQMQTSTAHGEAHSAGLTLHKVDSRNITKPLEGAEFTLQWFDPFDGTYKDVQTVTTNQNGDINLTFSAGSGDAKPGENAAGNTIRPHDYLYRLTETKAPTGYRKDDNWALYFIWTSDSSRKEAAYSHAVGSKESSIIVNKDAINYYYGSAAVYLQLTNESNRLTLVKQWYDKYNNLLAADKQPDSVQVELRRSKTPLAANTPVDDNNTELVDKIKLTKADNWTYNYAIPDAYAAYYYYVKEVQSGASYKVSYTGNDGVQYGGTIVITNTETENAGYELPSTGGTGTLPYTAVGGTMMLTALAYSFIHHKRRREGRADD